MVQTEFFGSETCCKLIKSRSIPYIYLSQAIVSHLVTSRNILSKINISKPDRFQVRFSGLVLKIYSGLVWFGSQHLPVWVGTGWRGSGSGWNGLKTLRVGPVFGFKRPVYCPTTHGALFPRERLVLETC